MKNLGDFIPGQTIRGAFNSRGTNGAPITLAGTPALSVYKDASTTEATTGVTLSVDFDSRTGYHVYTIVTTDAFYSRGSDFRVVLTAGTVDSVSVVGVEVGSFSLDNRPGEAIAFKSALTVGTTTTFTVTSGPSVDVGDVLAFFYTSAGVLRAIANGTYSATDLLTITAAPTDAIQGTDLVTVYPIAAAVGDASITTASIADGALTSAKFADGFLAASKIASDAITSAKLADGAITNAKLADNVITAAKIATDALTAAKIAADAVAEIFSSTDRTQLQTIFGKLPGKDYLAGTDNVDGNIEMSAAIGNFPGSVAGVAADGITALSLASDAVAEIQSGLATAVSLATVAGYLDTEIAAILADTNELQADWANGGRLDLILDTAAAGGGLDAAGVRAAVGLASANLDTQLSTIDTVVDSILVDTAVIGAAGAGLSAIPWNASWDAEIQSEVADALAAYDPPTNTEMEARTIAAASYATATVVNATKAVTDKLDTAMELDSTVYRFTTNALEQAPAGGGGGSSDWTADEKTVIRAVLGIPGSGTTPADPSTGILDTIRDQTTSAVLQASARAGVMGTWTDETGASFVLIITG